VTESRKKRKNKSSENPSAETSAEPKFNSRKKRWFFIVLSVLTVLLILAVAESILRLAKIGYPTQYFLTRSDAGKHVIYENQKYGWRFMPHQLARTPRSFSFPADKTKETIRIFVFGESAALGDPEPAFGFSRILEVMLSERFPQLKFEVINLSMTAINSHVLREIAREAKNKKGDFWLIYMGNNEVVGPFGAGTILGKQFTSTTLIQTVVFLKRIRIFQLFHDLLTRQLTKDTLPTVWAGMEMFTNQKISSDDPRLSQIYDSFSKNLKKIIQYGAKSCQYGVIVSTIAVNLKECAPFASIHNNSLSETKLNEFSKLLLEADTKMLENDYTSAESLLNRAVNIDPQYAEARFRLGLCYLALGKTNDALLELSLARDLDALRFRADSKINKIISETVNSSPYKNLEFIDTEKIFNETSPSGISGENFFFEHVHFNFSGNFLLAELFAQKIEKRLTEQANIQPSGHLPSKEKCASIIAFTPWNELNILENVMSRLIRPPFTFQYNNKLQQLELSRKISNLSWVKENDKFKEWVSIYENSLKMRPNDWEIHAQFARLLEAFNEDKAATEQWQIAKNLAPQNPVLHYQFGKLLNKNENWDDAIKELSMAISIIPFFPEAHNSLGIAYARKKLFDKAIAEFETALKLNPGLIDSHVNWGMVLAAQNKLAEAEAHYRAALTINSNYPSANINLARILESKGETNQALVHFQKGFRFQNLSSAEHYRLGCIASEHKSYLESISRFSEAVRADPQNLDARYRLANDLIKVGGFIEAHKQLTELVKLNPNLINARIDLGVSYARQRRFQEAIEQFETVLKQDPSNHLAAEYITRAKQFLSLVNDTNKTQINN